MDDVDFFYEIRLVGLEFFVGLDRRTDGRSDFNRTPVGMWKRLKSSDVLQEFSEV
jgi:hypothetical protein